MKKIVREFENGINKFVGAPVNQSTIDNIGEYIKNFLAQHPDDELLLMASMAYDFQNPYAVLESMLDDSVL